MTRSKFRFPETGPHAIKPWSVRKGYADEHFLSDYRFQFPRQDPALAEVYVYTPRMSYDPGETVEFHGSCNADTWTLQIYRDGHQPEMAYEAFDIPGAFTKTSETAYSDGCDWPVVHSWTIPEGQRPGFYRVVSTCMRKDGERFVQHHFFVVRPTPETQQGKILFMLATGTWTAYNDWGGANHYFGTFGPNKNEGSPHLSLHRPWTRGMLWLPNGASRIAQNRMPEMNDLPGYPSKEWGYSHGWGQYYAAAGWAQFDRHFAVWAEKEGFGFDIITQTDLHYRPEILDNYSCLVTVGHDEYWSWDMRKTVEEWVEKGGHFSRFGGNFLWQIRLEEDGARQVCWKTKAPKMDPVRDDPEKKHLLTASWESGGVSWPGASTVGVNGCHGMYGSWGGFAPRGSRGFTVYRPEHWAFEGTDLRYADVFGAEAGIFGYEVDGLNYTFERGLPYPVADPGVPEGIEILAMSPAVLFEYEHEGPGYRYYVRDSDLVGLAELAAEDYPVARRNYQYGSGMVVSMNRGKGEVFTAGSCEWIMGLTRRDPFTETITRNALERFSGAAD
ncbi:N,N-dimethylformamidase beta subunit family domain-containing protein [Albibacillus kandeliae]|uniref:N,N-dimethylformamidase beta subunit family domain-containing protein n=1 Tax=Albibacillus kandeliae TaxID=2174228 RepID=UPI000D69BC67|nr:N,N-dimethylformamidase beta subunit family domain-containing protein [Albibacillus kandeliae]